MEEHKHSKEHHDPPKGHHASGEHHKKEHSHSEHHSAHHKEASKGFVSFAYVIFGLIGVLLIYNFIQLAAVGELLDERIEEAEKASVAAVISLTTIADSSCSDCFDLTPLLERIEGAHVNITERVDLSVEEGAELLAQYGIEKLPTIIITGEINKSGISGLDEVDDALVLTAVDAPFVDVASGKVRGLVSVIHLEDPGCSACVDLAASIEELKQSLTITSVDTFARSSVNAKAAIAKYGIKQLPALILSSEYSAYSSAEDLESVGVIASDGGLVIETLQPPYVDAITGKVEGVVDWIMLTDASCAECYDVSMHKTILARFGFAFGKEETFAIDSARGKELLEQYGITSVPTIIVSSDAKAYDAFTQVWPQVGTEESDGMFVFRNNGILGQTYKDLETNTVIEGGSEQ